MPHWGEAPCVLDHTSCIYAFVLRDLQDRLSSGRSVNNDSCLVSNMQRRKVFDAFASKDEHAWSAKWLTTGPVSWLLLVTSRLSSRYQSRQTTCRTS